MTDIKAKYLEITGLAAAQSGSSREAQGDNSPRVTDDQAGLELDPKCTALIATVAKALQGAAPKPTEAVDPQKAVRQAALARAHDIRKFEIELYWKRANYFWLLQAAVFAAVGFTWRTEAGAGVPPGLAISPIVPIGLAGLGTVSACAGWLASLGSKFWQRNWEHHVDMLEGEFEGHLYKTVYVGRSGTRWSVSGVSEGLSLCFFLFWALLLLVISFSVNSWDLNPSHLSLSSFDGLAAQTLMAWVLTAVGLGFISRRGSQVTGERMQYPNDASLEPPEVSGSSASTPEAKKRPHLIRREPGIT